MKSLFFNFQFYLYLLNNSQKIGKTSHSFVTKFLNNSSKIARASLSVSFLLGLALSLGTTKSVLAQTPPATETLPTAPNPANPQPVSPIIPRDTPVNSPTTPSQTNPAPQLPNAIDNSVNAPQELKDLLASIDTAASQKNLQALMEFYSPQFVNSDGLNASTMSQALTRMWQQYPKLTYKTEIVSWQEKEGKLVAETVTNISGTQQSKARVVNLTSQLRSRQSFQDRKLLEQEIITENTQLTSGANPPQVEVTLPDVVRVGAKFDFDAIVREPLNDEVLLGTALEEKISGDRYLKPGTLELEALPAGGIFKTVTAPTQPENRWISAILIRGDGITMVTRRLRIEK
ncbi:MAG: nuclear transport factor 2 family protein [Xenococcaceae cyanobacterium]